ncbi:disease resistance protein RPM1-like [Camellia sinensis]|uniref:disease resistance protein RPM1-like n=1 Tax=Camellia sinensis TaxID=4442 RepID=UPI0010357EB5|nr:disease resistance protein RPM1-like [Camellia sinensis]
MTGSIRNAVAKDGELDFPKFYEDSHTSKKTNDWIHLKFRELHQEMVNVQAAAIESGMPLTQEEISRQVLGQKKRYLLGFGSGPQPSTIFATRAHDKDMEAMRAEVEALREERQKDHDELMKEREERERCYNELLKEREERIQLSNEMLKEQEEGQKVATFCKETSMDHVHELEALSEEKAWELFCKKAFQLDFEGHCPPELEEVSHAIVRKCQGLPLAIAAIGGLLSTKNKGISEWQKFYGSMHSELERNPNLTSIRKILLLSYNDLPHYLKSCFLYFGIMPEDYSISYGRLIRLWIAEGFIEEQKGKTMEEVAEECLIELIHRRLVLVSTTKFDGRVRQCQVHDVVREIILSMSEEFSFCQILEENSSFNDTTRRLSMHMHYCNMDKVMKSIGKSPVRSVFLFQVVKLLKKPFLGTLAANFRLLKVLDLQNAPLHRLHEEVGNLFLLRFLSIWNTNVKIIPKSIGKLHNLQTLDLKHSPVRELPFDISRFHKLRHILACSCNRESNIVGVKIHGGIGGLEELQSLWYVRTNHGLIKELENLRQLRKLGITKLRRKHGRALCTAIEKMKYLKRLSVRASSDDEILDVQYISSPPKYLQCLVLVGRLEKLPDWNLKLQNLVTLRLLGSSLTKNDPLKALQVLPSLVRLVLVDAYDGE